MARCVPGGLEVKPDWAGRQDIGGIVERCFCGVGTKSEVTARRARYLGLLDAEFFEDGLFLLEIDNRLGFYFVLLLSDELSLSDLAAESFDFLVALLVGAGFGVFFVEGARWAPLVFFVEDLSIDCWRWAIVLCRSLVASFTPFAIKYLDSGRLNSRFWVEDHGCWTNIVSTLLLLGIRSLNALLAHSIAVNTSYRSSLGTTNPGIQALIALDLVIRRK
jgi:hypothetical protein